MRILKLVLTNPQLNNIVRYTQTIDDILNNNIKELTANAHGPSDDDKAKKMIQAQYDSKCSIHKLKDPINFKSLLFTEELLSKYEHIDVVSIPDVSISVFVVCVDLLPVPKTVPYLWCISDYIDFIYCLYSYLII